MATELEQLVVKNCQVTEAQAKGGIGIILVRAKRRMAAADFAKAAKIVPNCDATIRDAAKADIPIQSSFAIKLYPTVLEFIKSKAGNEVADLFDKAIFSP